MGRKKLFRDGYRICSKCNTEESDDCPFPPTGNQCKSCLQDYNTTYIRNKRGQKPRSEKMSAEQRHQNKLESTRRWHKKAKQGKALSAEEQEQLRIKRLLAEAEEYRDYK
jgi:hypothetical protein